MEEEMKQKQEAAASQLGSLALGSIIGLCVWPCCLACAAWRTGECSIDRSIDRLTAHNAPQELPLATSEAIENVPAVSIFLLAVGRLPVGVGC